MAKQAPVIRRGFIRGVKSSVDPSSVPPDALHEARNVRADMSGIIRIRLGNKRFNTSPGAGHVQALKSAFGKILSVWNRNVYLYDDAGAQTQIGADIIGAAATDPASVIRWARGGKEIAYFFAGNGIYETDGATTKKTHPFTPATGEKTNLIRVAIPNPTAAPTLTTATTGGSLPAATYHVGYTWTTDTGETVVGAELSIGTTGTTSTITVTLPAFPSGVTGAKIYIGTAAATGTLQGSTTTTTYTQSAALAAGTARPTANTAIIQDLGSGPAKCKIAVLKASLSQRLAVTGDPASPNTVYFSAPLDATYFPSDQILQLPDDGGKITGMMNWYNTLVIFRDKDIWAFFGSSVTDTSASLVLQDSSIGCIQGNTVCFVPSVGLVFLGPDNIYALNGVAAIENQVKPVPIGDDVIRFVQQATTYDLSKTNAVYFDREYRISFPDVLEPERVLRLNLLNGPAWYVDTGPMTSRYVVHEDKLFAAEYQSGLIYLFDDSLMDDGEKIPLFSAFRRESLEPGPGRIKKLFIYVVSKGAKKELDLPFFGASFNEREYNERETEHVLINSGSEQHLKVQIVVDNVDYEVKELQVSVTRGNALAVGDHEPVRVYEARFQPSLKGSFAQIKVFSEQADEDIAILGYGIEYSNRERIHGIKQGVTV